MRSRFDTEGGNTPFAMPTPTLARSAMRVSLILSVLLSTACDLAPEFKLPNVEKPAAFKEADAAATPTVEPAEDGKWKRFDETAHIDEFAWWRMFNDENLNGLMDQALKENPTIEVAMARVTAARAAAGITAAELLPSVDVGIGPQRTRGSADALNANSPPAFTIQPKPYTLYTARGTISYELDLFGRNRARARADEEAAKAELERYRTARLTLATDLAQTYFRVAALRAEDKVLNDTITTRADAVKLMHQRLDAGATDALTVASQETDLASATADETLVAQALAANEHALAILVGKPPSELSVESPSLDAPPPSVPQGMPSSLLERRPDILEAERNIAAANEQIGVARSGYFPDISLSAAFGFVSSDVGDLFKWSNRTWTIGPLAGTMLTQPIFEGGRVAAYRAQTDAQYTQAVSSYRSTVLNAFREVEDQLSGLRNANLQLEALDKGLAAATRAYKVADQRYKAGYSSHLEFLDAERNLLAAKRAYVQVQGNRYITTVQLVKALGGSWQSSPAPEPIAAPAKEDAKAPEAPKEEMKKSSFWDEMNIF